MEPSLEKVELSLLALRSISGIVHVHHSCGGGGGGGGKRGKLSGSRLSIISKFESIQF